MSETYLKEGLERYGGDVRFALAYYHSGNARGKVDELYKKYKQTGVYEIPKIKKFHDGRIFTADYVDEIVARGGITDYTIDEFEEKANGDRKPTVNMQVVPSQNMPTYYRERNFENTVADAINGLKQSFDKSISMYEKAIVLQSQQKNITPTVKWSSEPLK